MERNLSYDDAWKQMFNILETLKDEDDMLPLLEGQIGYVLDVYYKRKCHLEMLLNMSRHIYESGERMRKIYPEDFEHEKEEEDDE